MSTLLIATAPEDLLMDYPGLDVGVIDRVGFPDLEVFDGFAPAYLEESFTSPWRIPVQTEVPVESATPAVETTPAP